jgi:iron complex outermembrane receptor protein
MNALKSRRSFNKNNISKVCDAVLKGITVSVLLSVPLFSYAEVAIENTIKTEESIEVIQVRGIRGSQKANLNAKRFSDSIVDVVNAEDIGKFPDTNIAESLQRISGVSIDRAKGEGRKISIRGLGPDLVNVTLNGRTVVSANPEVNLNNDGGSIGRSFSFDVLQADLISGLEVHKSPSATLLEGGVAGSVDMKTHRPLDAGKRIISASLSAAYDDFAESTDPKASFLFSDIFADDTMGFSLGLAYSDRSLREDRADGIVYAKRDLTVNGEEFSDVYLPGNLRAFHFNDQRERLNVTSAFQYSIQDNLMLSVDALFAAFDNTQNLSDLPLRQHAGGGFGAYTALHVNDNDVADAYTITDGVRPRLDRIRSNGQEELQVFGANLLWEGDTVSIEFDTSYSAAEYNEDLVRLGYDATTNSSIDVKLNGLVPDIISNADLNDPSIYGLNVAYNDSRIVKDDEIQAKLEATYQVEGDFFSTLQAGVRYSKRTKNSFYSRINAAGTFRGALLSDLPGENAIEKFPVTDFLSSFKGDFPRSWIEPNIDVAYNHFFIDRKDELLDSAYGTPTTSELIEDVTAFYFQANFANDDSLPIRGNFGLRMVRTDSSSTGLVKEVIAIDPADESVEFSEALSKTVDSTYWDILPSLNITLTLADDVLARFAVAKTMSRPRVEDLSPATLAVNPSILLVKEGNPHLDPFRATQYDANLEWYYNETSILSAGLFYKDVESFIYTAVSQEPLIVDGAPVLDSDTGEPINLQHDRPINGEGGGVWGYELNLQHSFGEHFGTAVNYTFVDTSAEFSNAGQTFGIPGLSEDNFNGTVYYETDLWSARISYNYRSEFLAKVAGVGSNPIFTNSYGQFDFTSSYNLTDNIVLRFEGINLTGEVTEKYAINSELMRNYAQTGRRYQLSVSASF